MALALVSGSAGQIGSEAARRIPRLGLEVVGTDDNLAGWLASPAAVATR
ncbi:hypothetical protein [Micromonospora sp. NPDC005413]